MAKEKSASDVRAGCNISHPTMRVYHSALQVFDDPFKRICPACGVGLLLVTRDEFNLTRHDRCTMCGQNFWYLDDDIGEEPLVEPISGKE